MAQTAPMPTDAEPARLVLTDRVDVLIAHQARQAQEKQDRQAQETRERNERALATLREQWEADVPADVRAQLAPVDFRLCSPGRAVVAFTFDGETWTASPFQPRETDVRGWRFDAPDGKYTQDAEAGKIAAPLITLLARRRRERQQNVAAAEAQAAAEARYVAALAAVSWERWQWPAGREITLFRFTWHMTPASEYGSGTESGWAVTDRPDRDGYLRFEPEHDIYGHGAPREIRVATLSPAPMVERRKFTCVADLPPELREPQLVTLEPDEDFDQRSIGDHQHRVGVQPLAWVRALVDG